MSDEDQDQSQAPILQALQDYHRRDTLPFTTPGHKMGRGIDEYTAGILGRGTFLYDVPELAGYDDRRLSKSVKTRAEQLAAQLYGADQCLFSTNGSSLSMHAALLTVAGPGETVLVGRNLHKSVIAAIILSGVRPVWMYPPVDENLNFQHGVTPAQVWQALAQHPDARAVIVTSPSYLGVASRLTEIADACHQRHVPLLVDEAWGPHFPFHPAFPAHAMACGADLSVGSVHKMLNGIQQSSVILARQGLVDLKRMMLCFDLYETTSASPIMTGSIDGARRHMALRGAEVWGRTLELSRRLRAAIEEIPGLALLGEEVLERPEVGGLDITKVTVEVTGLGLTGMAAADWLDEHRGITVELADQCRIMAVVSLGDSDGTIGRFVEGLRAVAAWAGQHAPGDTSDPITVPPLASMEPELAMSPREALLGNAREVPLDEASDLIAAEMISPYPPGIPAIAPGERFSRPILDYLHAIKQMQVAIPDATDPSLQRVRVVA